MPTTTAIGKEGEDAAAGYLQRQGYDILCRNYRFRKAEVDIIARKEDLLVVVEVKTRTDTFYEALDQSLSPLQKRRLIKAADHFARQQPEAFELRFDIIQVLRSRRGFAIHHIRDAFYFF